MGPQHHHRGCGWETPDAEVHLAAALSEHLGAARNGARKPVPASRLTLPGHLGTGDPAEAGSLSTLLRTHRGWMLNFRGDFLCECVL